MSSSKKPRRLLRCRNAYVVGFISGWVCCALLQIQPTSPHHFGGARWPNDLTASTSRVQLDSLIDRGFPLHNTTDLLPDLETTAETPSVNNPSGIIPRQIRQQRLQGRIGDTRTMFDQPRSLPNEDIGMKVLLFFTAHARGSSADKPSHVDFFRHCWPLALERSNLLKSADVIVHAATDGNVADDSALESVLPQAFVGSAGSQNIKFFRNPGYQEGAIQSMTEAVSHKWFAGYDWVLRLNPDVIVRDDEFLLRAMRNQSIDAILAQCPIPIPDASVGYAVHSDFFAFRPRVANDTWFQILPGEKAQAETHATHQFMEVMAAHRHVFLPNVRHYDNQCRLLGRFSPIIHYHHFVKQCQKGSLSGGHNGNHALYTKDEWDQYLSRNS